MFLKYLEISKHMEQNPWKKDSDRVIFGEPVGFLPATILKINIYIYIYAGCFQDSTLF